MRTAFINELFEAALRNERIFLIVGDLGFSVVEPFAREFPARFVNVGVAEQNMTGVAAGLASEGFHVFTYSIANFPTFRCAEQIRNDIAYHNLPVTVVSVGGGLAYGSLGYSHHAVQDIALLRTFPNMTIACPGDPVEARACVRYFVQNPRPSYLRLGKAGEPKVHASEVAVAPGKILRQGEDWNRPIKSHAVLSTAATLSLAQHAVKSGGFEADWDVCSLPVWNSDSGPSIREFIAKYQSILVIEDHLRAGGFGSFVQECLDPAPDLLARVRCLALDPKVCGHVASQDVLNQMGGLSLEGVIRLVASLDKIRSL